MKEKVRRRVGLVLGSWEPQPASSNTPVQTVGVTVP